MIVLNETSVEMNGINTQPLQQHPSGTRQYIQLGVAFVVVRQESRTRPEFNDTRTGLKVVNVILAHMTRHIAAVARLIETQRHVRALVIFSVFYMAVWAW